MTMRHVDAGRILLVLISGSRPSPESRLTTRPPNIVSLFLRHSLLDPRLERVGVTWLGSQYRVIRNKNLACDDSEGVRGQTEGKSFTLHSDYKKMSGTLDGRGLPTRASTSLALL